MLDNFFKFFNRSVGTKPVLGVDIGTVSVKIAEILEKGGRPTMVNYGMIEVGDFLERPNSAIQTSSLKVDTDETARILKELTARMKSTARECVAVVPSFSSFVSLIDLPVMTNDELAQAMPLQARSLVPLPISEVSIDWTVIGNYEDEKGAPKQQVLLISIPNEQIALYQNMFKKAGLKLKMVEIEGLSLARSLSAGDPGVSMIIDIGGFSSAVAIASKGLLYAVSQTDFASNSLTQALVKGLGINPRRAETLKKQRGLVGMTGEYGLSTLMFPFVDVILNEARRMREIYESKHGKKIEKVILSGGGSDLIGLPEYVSNQFAVPVEKGNPFRGLSYPSEIAPLAANISSRFSVAIGAGMKSV
ncbi:MAG: type IV pilus assembly protein PilM [Candidatus Colwellbacteria bacterium]|nr:type IV pilus assembly protein PilM [Candidatus Colwellbacteria bacterium]